MKLVNTTDLRYWRHRCYKCGELKRNCSCGLFPRENIKK